MNGDASRFDLTGPLPDDLTLLEASAGTGKTYALAALATRFVAERGLSAAELCIVTFTEAATAELRGRVRSRFGEALAHLESGGGAVDDDPVLTHLGCGSDTALAERAANLRRGLADFDAATIATIHGFCSRMVGHTPGVDGLSADDRDLRELVIDRLLAELSDGDEMPYSIPKLVQAVELRLRMPDAAMFTVPDDLLDAGALERARRVAATARFVDELVDEARRRRSERRTRTFDGLLVEARDALAGADGEALVASLRRRFRLVLIDEFQDTDAVQWTIFRRAFLDPVDGTATAPVVLVGDPKQSIYRFRSAELSAYLTARRHAVEQGGSVQSLDVNRRTDRPLLDALELVFRQTSFGDPVVRFEPVAAAPDRSESRLRGVGEAALELRVLPDGESTPECRAVAVADLAAQVVELLRAGEILDDDDARPVQPADIGVLVRSNVDAAVYADALAAAGVPAARSSSESVLDSEAAHQWRVLLSALERPGSVPRARAAHVSWFLGHTPTELDALDDEGVAGLVEQLRRWAALLDERGLPALFGSLRDHGLLGRVLARRGGERDLTDLDHVAELLASATGGRRTSASALLAALDQLALSGAVADDEGVTSDVLARRIDRDDDTVKILTVHKAKGLEFPVVLCPTLWTPPLGITGLGHAHVDGRRLLDTDVLSRPSGSRGSKRKAEEVFTAVTDANRHEHHAEALRLLYVALTRAKHRLVVWWAKPPRTATSALASVLATAGGGEIDLDGLAGRSGGRIAVARARRPASPPAHRTAAPAADLDVAVAQRRVERTWAVWSFTGIEHAARSLAAHRPPEPARATPPLEALMAIPPDLPIEGGHDEHGPTADVDVDDEPGEVASLPLATAPGGRVFGTLVHSVLEHVDFRSPALVDDLRGLVAERLAFRRLDVDADVLAHGLADALRAPLGGPLGATRLTDVARADRLDELAFDLPLARLDASTIGSVLAAHLAPDDPLRPWADRAASGELRVDVEGMLTGSIDLVARTCDGRYWLADHKTNRLPDARYDLAATADAMAAQGYPLQASLYLVALHRYLRWRIPGYDPERQLLGAAYLFLRGMDPTRPADDPVGVHWFAPPVAAVDALDRLLATGRAA